MACTAKINSILNCDTGADCLFSARRMSDGRLVESVANRDDISNWNSDTNVKQIYLVGAFQNIRTPFVVYDTPGTNNSLNLEHMNITYKFLTDNPPRLLAFVINAENNGSNDEAEFMCWLKENLIGKRGTEIIFIINKMDSPDFEREDLNSFMQDTYNGLINLGFKSPIIFPVSANAALLFRMLLNGRELNRKESRVLASYYDYFLNDGLSLTAAEPIELEDTPSEVISFNGRDYAVEKLHKAIRRTGICDLEEFLTYKFREVEEDTSNLKFIVVDNPVKPTTNSRHQHKRKRNRC